MQIKSSKLNRRERFIEKAREVHADKYNYNSVIYVNSTTKITIFCKTHGNFQQTPTCHLRGCGCQKCGITKRSKNRRQTLYDFIYKAQEKHKDKYCYDQIVNYSASAKVPIKCPIHGVFMMEPYNHLAGQGCKACGTERRASKCRSSAEEFIAKARKIHKDRYRYNNVIYVNARTKVTIKCERHGLFEQTPYTHLLGRGCNKCAVEQKGKMRELGMGAYIERARGKHNNFYDYALVSLEASPRSKAQIRCPKHGLFSQDFYQHANGMGCPKCYDQRRGMKRKSNEQFIRDAQLKHGNTYDYSEAEYINAYTKVTIKCPSHGLFELTPTKHLSRGDGCPECGLIKRKGIGAINEARLNKDPELGTIDAWVYIAFLEKGEEKFFKIGHTTNKHPINRFSFLHTYHWTIEHAVSKSLCEALKLENELKRVLPKYKPQHKFSGYTECTLEDPWPLLMKLLRKP